MEVLMGRHTNFKTRSTRGRRRNRLSRPLIIALLLTIAVGGGFYIHFQKTRRTNAAPPVKGPISLMAVEPVAPDVKPMVVPPVATAASGAPGVKETVTPLIVAPPGVLVTETPTTAMEAVGAALLAQTAAPRVTPPVVVPASVPLSTPSSPLAAPPTRAAEIRPVPAQPAPTPIAIAAPNTPAPKAPVLLASAAAPVGSPLAQARVKMDGGDLLAARGILNSALAGGQLSSADAASARHLIATISQTVFFSNARIKDDPFQTLYQVQGGDRLSRIADRHAVTWELLCRINGLSDPKKLRAGQSIKVPTGPFHCVITKKDYRLDVYLGSPGEAGSVLVISFMVGLGKDNSTPAGAWIIAQGGKVHPATYYSPRGEGVIAPDDPKNPLGGYWMGLTGIAGNALEKNSYGIHGTIEPDTVGKQASMGCIRLRHDDIAFLYDLLVDGKSKVVVKE
jgi:LysM repeat protein